MRDGRDQVLIIDDNALMGEILADYLRTEDLAVRVAKSGEQALRMLAAEPADVVVIDLVMPGMGGLEILARATRRQPHPEVIIVTAYGTVETAVRAIQLGAFDYLQKPVNPEVLRDTVLRAIERRRLLAASEELRQSIDLLEHCRRMSASHDRAAIVEQALWALLASTSSPSGLVLLVARGDGDRRVLADEGLTASQATDLSRSLEEQVLRETINRPRTFPLEEGVTALATPVRAGDELVAVVAAFKPRAGDFSPADVRHAQFVGEQAGLALRFPSHRREDGDDVYVDAPTGLYNQRYFEVMLAREIVVAQAEPGAGRTFSILVVALDDVGAVNDRLGHRIGSKVLVEIARVIRHRVRDIDPVFRLEDHVYGVLLRGSDLEESRFVAERILEDVAAHPFLKREGLELRLTVSVAIASYPQHAATQERLVELATRGLADRSGPGMVIVPTSERD
jgi:two-component system cell cycle response regulator